MKRIWKYVVFRRKLRTSSHSREIKRKVGVN